MSSRDIHVPDIGTDEKVDVVEVLVSAGDEVAVDDGLVTLENFDLPCTNAERQVVVDTLVKRLGPADVKEMRRELGGRQRFLDGMSMLW